MLLFPMRFFAVLESVIFHSREVTCQGIYPDNTTLAAACTLELGLQAREESGAQWLNDRLLVVAIASYFQRPGTTIFLSLPRDTLW